MTGRMRSGTHGRDIRLIPLMTCCAVALPLILDRTRRFSDNIDREANRGKDNSMRMERRYV